MSQEPKPLSSKPIVRPVSRGSRPISVKSSSTHHKRTQSPKAFSAVSQTSCAMSEAHFREGEFFLREDNVSQCYESYRQGFKALKIRHTNDPAGFESKFTSKCAVLLSHCQKLLDDKQPQSAKDITEAIMALCDEFSHTAPTSIPITSSFMNSHVSVALGQPIVFPTLRFNALNKLGLCERQLGNYQSGLEHLLSAIDIAQQHGLNTGETWVNLAAVYMSLKNWRKGRHASQEAVSNLMKENPAPHPKKVARLIAIAHYNAGKCNEKLNDLQEAIDGYRAGIKILKGSGIDPQEQLYKSISYAFLQTMKDFKDGVVKRKQIVDIVEYPQTELRGFEIESELHSDPVPVKKFTVVKNGQIRQGTTASLTHSKGPDALGIRSPLSNNTNPLSRSINLANRNEARGQLFNSLHNQVDGTGSRIGQNSLENRDFFQTVEPNATVKIDPTIKSGPVKSPWVIRSKGTGKTDTGRPPLKPSTNTNSASGLVRPRNTTPGETEQFRVTSTPKQMRKTHQGTYSGENGWRESQSGLGAEESWDELAGQKDAQDITTNSTKPLGRRSLAARELMRENRLQLAMELKDINQKLIGMDLVPLRLPKTRFGADDSDQPNVHQVLSGGPRFGETSSFQLKNGVTDGYNTSMTNPIPNGGSKKGLVIIRKQNTQSGRTSQASGVQSAEMMTPTGKPLPEKPMVPIISKTLPLGKSNPKRGGSLSEPSPKNSATAPIVATNKASPTVGISKDLAASRIQRNWEKGKLAVPRVKGIVRKRYPASTYVCSYYLRLQKDGGSPGSKLPTKVVVFLHRDSYLLVAFVLPKTRPTFSLLPKTLNVLGHPEKLRLAADSKVYFDTNKPADSEGRSSEKKAALDALNPPGEDTVRPLFRDESSADQTTFGKPATMNLPIKDISQDDDLLQPLIPISVSGRDSRRDEQADLQADQREAEIEQLKEQILQEYLQDGVESGPVKGAAASGKQQVMKAAGNTDRSELGGTAGQLGSERQRKQQSEAHAESLKQREEEDKALIAKQTEEARQKQVKLEEEARLKQLQEEAERNRLARERLEEEERAKKAKVQAEEAERLKQEQDKLKQQLRLLQEEKDRQEAEIKKQKQEAEEFLKKQQIAAAELIKKNELEAQMKADQLRKKMEDDLLEQKRVEEARIQQMRADFLLQQQKEEETKRQDLIAKQKLEEENAQRIVLEEAEKRASEKLEAEKKEKDMQTFKKGMASLFMKKSGEQPAPKPKPAVVTKRYGNITELREEEKLLAEAQAAGFIQDFLKFQKIDKELLRKQRAFLGSARIDLPENQYLIEAHKICENPLQPSSLDEIVISGMGIVRLCVLKELKLASSSAKVLDGLSPSQVKAKVIELIKSCLTIKDSSKICYLEGKEPQDAKSSELQSSVATAQFGGMKSENGIEASQGLETKPKFTASDAQMTDLPNLVKPTTSVEIPSHQSLDLASDPLPVPPVALEASKMSPPRTPSRYGDIKPPQIMITPAPPTEDNLTPSPSRELFSFMFYAGHGQSCKVVYKEPAPTTPVIEFYNLEGVFQGFQICPIKISRKEDLGRLLRWTIHDELPKIDLSGSSKFSGDPAVESAGYF